MFHRDAVAAGFNALRLEARLHHRRRRVHRQHARRPAERRGHRGRRLRRLPNRPPGVRRRPARAPGGDVVEGDVLDPGRARARRSRDATRSSTCRPTRTCATASSIRDVDLEQNTIATSRRARGDARRGRRRASPSPSTGSVYGEPEVFPTPEDAPFPVQTSLYGASKLAGEGLISAYATGTASPGSSFASSRSSASATRTGTSSTSSAPCKRDPTRLRVLGDGRQEKSYLYVQDCVTAMLTAARHHEDEPGCARLQPRHRRDDRRRRLDRDVITAHLGVAPAIEHTGGRRGWLGDSPLIHLDCAQAPLARLDADAARSARRS